MALSGIAIIAYCRVYNNGKNEKGYLFDPEEFYSTSSQRIITAFELAPIRAVGNAFSGGVDSSLLLALATEELGEDCLALTVAFHSAPESEIAAARASCQAMKVKQIILDVDELKIPRFSENPPDRCYHCKVALFSMLKARAQAEGFSLLADGTNADDRELYRPGLLAIDQLKVLSPLAEQGFTKSEVRELSRRLQLDSADAPSRPCLATRFPYGEKLTASGLARVRDAESFLEDCGLHSFRVRSHSGLARIEAAEEDWRLFSDSQFRAQVESVFKELGFDFVAVDLFGFRSGSMDKSSKL